MGVEGKKCRHGPLMTITHVMYFSPCRSSSTLAMCLCYDPALYLQTAVWLANQMELNMVFLAFAVKENVTIFSGWLLRTTFPKIISNNRKYSTGAVLYVLQVV